VERVEVKQGDTIDFSVDLRGSFDSDSFLWSPKVRYLEAAGGKGESWNARADFAGPSKQLRTLTAWEKYAQVLLFSNELMFVD
jgi:hypothetical protein